MGKKMASSVRVKLFATLAIVIIIIIAFLIIVSNTILETIYLYSKKNTALDVLGHIDSIMEQSLKENRDNGIIVDIDKTSIKNNFEILIMSKDKEVLYDTDGDFTKDFTEKEIADIGYNISYSILNRSDVIFSEGTTYIKRLQDRKYDLNFLLIKGELKCGDIAYIRIPILPIQESVNISNQFLTIIGVVTIVLGGIAIVVITDRFTKPIEKLNEIANSMANLDFSKKYRISDNEDEINELGRSINTLSDKLESTIDKLKKNNLELEKNIENKSKIDEMRKQFISDVSHELKTPIALIQGYAEGLVENVVTEEEDKKQYLSVILDEANKMDSLVKRLLELMKLEYDERKFSDNRFDLVDLINGVIKNSKVMLEDEKITVEFAEKDSMWVYADDFYIEQVVTNYFTNAIKNNVEKNGVKKIKISIKNAKDPAKYRVTVFNTGNNISDENLERIWTRFYKVDSSRDRSKGGTGIGLALVRAIMNKYNNAYGVVNKKDGVEFYFEIHKDTK